MLALTSPVLQVLMIAGAVLAVAVVAVLVSRGGTASGPLHHRLALRTAPVVALVLVAQGCAVTAVGLAINNSYGFYTSWSDLLGGPSTNAPIRTGGLVTARQGAVHVFTVHAHEAGHDDRVLVWTPRQYQDPAVAQRRLPVVMFLPGQPSSPAGTFRHFQFASIATRLIDSGKVPPFVAVIPTLMIDPPRDTECTDIPGGPRAASWLEKDVPTFVTQHYRVQPLGRGWTVMGWSTGGFCAAKLLTAHPANFSSAVSFGGYYQPLEDRTTGNLFGGRTTLEERNSPMWLYQEDLRHGGLSGARMLLVAGAQDKETWPQTRSMIDVARFDPAVAHIVFTLGGHNYPNYRHYLPAALRWSASGWPR
jgi:enterochelin esterase-like enzyme